MTMIRDALDWTLIRVNMSHKFDWDAELESHKDYVWFYWFIAQNWAVARYSSRDPGDVRSVATEALMLTGKAFDEQVERGDVDPENRRLFWAMLKNQIRWSMWQSNNGEGSDDEAYDDREEIRSELRPRDENYRSMLQRTIAREMRRTLTTESQLCLALRFFEDLTRDEIVRAFDSSRATITRRLQDAAFRVLQIGLRHTVDNPPDKPPTQRTYLDDKMPTVEAWIADRYGCTVDEYLDYVTVMYLLDSHPIAEMMRYGNGNESRVVTRSNSAKLTDAQVREIRRRNAGGETQASIAETFGMSRAAISLIVAGKAYADVA